MFEPTAGQTVFTLAFAAPLATVDRLRLREDLTYGHVVRSFRAYFCVEAGQGANCTLAGNGTSVGAGKLVPLNGSLGQQVTSIVVMTDAQPAVSLTVEAFNTCSAL